MTPYTDKHILPKSKHKNRKARYTFPNELDDQYENVAKRKRRHSISFISDEEFDSYNEKHIIVIKNTDGVKKEVIIKKYTKTHPDIQEDNEEDLESIIDSTKITKIPTSRYRFASGVLSKVAINIIHCIGLLSCIAI